MRRSSEAYRRSLERRRKEDEARRLRDVLPALAELEFELCEERLGMPGHEVHHKRVIVVSRAPALFEFPCSDRSCDGGGHDITAEVLGHLTKGELRFVETHRCEGKSRDSSCEYVLRLEAKAVFSTTAEASAV
jgi:hypothetical protein